MPMTKDVPRWHERVKEIPSKFDDVSIPSGNGHVAQNEEWCEVTVDGETRRIRFHDYDQIYEIPGLYEELFYKQLQCCSPSRTIRLLQEVLGDAEDEPQRLKVLDLGAGNGMVGDELRARQAETIYGIDILPEARMATERDRPGVYDAYWVMDLTDLPKSEESTLRDQEFNCLTSVAALGFGDIPPQAFIKATDLIETLGWMALTIKEDFLRERDTSGFCSLIRRLNREEVIQIQAYRRFRHRLAVSGKPLYYVAMVARKLRSVPVALSCD